MRIYHIPDGHAQVTFDVFTDPLGFVRQGKSIDDDSPLRSYNDPGADLGINFALKPIDIFRNSLAEHINLFENEIKISY
jgi:hypothetical protein